MSDSVANFVEEYTPKTADEKSWATYKLMLLFTAVVLGVLYWQSKLSLTDINFFCPNSAWLNIANVIHIVVVVGLLVYYTTDDFNKMDPDERRNGVMKLAGVVFVYHLGRIIYRSVKPC